MLTRTCLGGGAAATLSSLSLSIHRSSFLFRSTQTLTLPFSRRFLSYINSPSLRHFSAAAATEEEQKAAVAVKPPQWKAAIDFKWIRDNKDMVAANIKNRNSNANLELVLEFYEKFLNLQKLYCEKECLSEDQFTKLKSFVDIGDILGASGSIKKTEKGELSVYVKNFEIPTKSLLPLPDKFHGLTDIAERYRQRLAY